MSVKCCYGCVPPKRTDTCHATCSDYIIDAAFHAVQKDESDRDRQITTAIYYNRGAKVDKALKKRKSRKG